jgi:hypothetical protein
MRTVITTCYVVGITLFPLGIVLESFDLGCAGFTALVLGLALDVMYQLYY